MEIFSVTVVIAKAQILSSNDSGGTAPYCSSLHLISSPGPSCSSLLNQEKADSFCSFPVTYLCSVFITMLLKILCKTMLFPAYCVSLSILHFFPFHNPPKWANIDISSRFEHIKPIIWLLLCKPAIQH